MLETRMLQVCQRQKNCGFLVDKVTLATLKMLQSSVFMS